ncbi:hypothetical protein BDP55DRAFT_630468 [Colletotrichum godetiae]|uniref:Uncharacterized protein n=1 Tax=Colletotrichum godetiae TaxID=1209918 RepID=A0AAJ0EXN3_9PEZI|nr:uncharacterized protein BDP55DRAFT_630468 [Colletotrichum godetiae]KAK1687836.1 hypothetical protein BDP55DRAFT_630468 [Colletotrichum godetiae]
MPCLSNAPAATCVLPSPFTIHVDSTATSFLAPRHIMQQTLPRSDMWGIWKTPRDRRSVHVSEWLTAPGALARRAEWGPGANQERTRSELVGKGPETTTHPHQKLKYRLNSSICSRRSSLASLGAFFSAPARQGSFTFPLQLCNWDTRRLSSRRLQSHLKPHTLISSPTHPLPPSYIPSTRTYATPPHEHGSNTQGASYIPPHVCHLASHHILSYRCKLLWLTFIPPLKSHSAVILSVRRLTSQAHSTLVE